MRRLTLDIETTLDHNTIWICVTEDVDTGEVIKHTTPATLKDLVQTYDTFIGHNIIGFDAPVLAKVWDIHLASEALADTLVMSRLVNPQLEGGHSLDSWGKRLGNHKIQFTDYDGGLTDEMVEYCIQDVALTTKVYLHLLRSLQEWKSHEQSLEIEHRIAEICRGQEVAGFTLDIHAALTLRAELSDKMGTLESEVQSVFPPIVEERWSEKTGKRLKDKVTVFNLASRKQIAERLQSLGWVPQEFTDKGSPKVNEKVLANVAIPQAQMIGEYLMLQKRLGMVDSWLKFVDDNDRVHGRVITNGAVTGRMTHHSPNMGQIPSVKSPYGKECRALWTVDKGNVLVGTDLSGIELRCLAHYMQDEEYTKELIDGDIHTKNQKAADLPTRDMAKTFIYATLYGGGAEKIGNIVGGGAKEGKRLTNNFFDATPALAGLVKRVKKIAEKGTVPGLDGRRVIIRSEHAALNSLLQSCGAIIAKQWCIEAHRMLKEQGIPVKQVAFVHDEIQMETPKQYGETVAKIMVEAAAVAGKVLGFRVPVDAEAKIGLTWYATH